MKNLLLLFLICFVWVSFLPLYTFGEAQTENQLPDEEYVLGVMLGMATDILSEEALKAVAVTVRTYTCFHGKTLPTGTVEQIAYQTSKEHSQKVYDAMKSAVYSTSGEYITYGGRVINAMFHTCSYLSTADGELPYLKSVPTDDGESYTPMHTSSHITKAQIESYGKGEITGVSYGTDRKPKWVIFSGGEVSAEEFGSEFKLISRDFTLSKTPDGGYSVICSGEGNGLGLSLYGAYVMGEKGYGYTEIINKYFTDVYITKAS